MNDSGSPWIEVPDDWLDDKYSNHNGYRALQEYFSVKIKPDVVNEYLIGKGILPHVKIEVGRFTAKEIKGNLGVDATLIVTGNTRSGGNGTDSIEIYRTINGPEKECRFDKIGASTVNLGGFGVEYYRRVVPFLDKLGVKKITTSPTTGPEESPAIYQFTGAYVWSFYGYTNDNMAGTLNQYIDYLKNVRKMSLTKAEEARILNIDRMVDLAMATRPDGEQAGKQFLLGIDAQNISTRHIWWNGTHHNIGNRSDSNEEMTELIDYLLRKMK